MSEHYEVGLSPDGSYVFVREIKRAISLDLALRFTSAFTTLGESSNVSRCLIDVRGTKSIAGAMGEYDYAYKKAGPAGLTQKWRVALVKDTTDTTHDFLLTVMDNAGHTFKMFEDEGEAVAWLTDG